MRKICLLFVFTFLLNQINAQQLLTENFAYTPGQPLTSNGWSLNGFPPINPINVSPNGLSYSGYVLSNVGYSASVNNTGMDVYQAGSATVSANSVYAAFMYKVDTARIGDYFFGLLSSINPNTYGARVYLKTGASGYYKIGLAKNTDTAIYTTDSFAIGSTSMIVVKYTFATGSATNDTVSLFHLTSGFPSTQPSVATLQTNGKGSQDLTDVLRVALRQGTNTLAPNLSVDGIRIGQTWNDLNAVTTNQPGKLQFINVNQITFNSARINMTKPTNFKNNLHNVVVFLKKGASINAGPPTASVYSYFPDTAFGVGSPYVLDTATCVYNADSNFVVIGGLTPLTRYTVVGFAATEFDSLYSAGTTASFTTLSTAPGNAFGTTFTATSKYTARVSWIRSNNYNTTLHTQVVFIKEFTPIGTGANTRDPNYIIADTNYYGIGSRYQNDTAARCIYNGDGTSVNVYGLKAGTRYYITILGANVNDSAYSNASTGTGTTPTGGPAALTNLRFTGKLENTSTVTWNRPTGYVDADQSILIFMRKDTMNSIYSTPVLNPSSYTADSNFANNPSRFEFDTAAKCIYNGDGTGVTIKNLKINTMYYLVGYVVRTDSSLYSLATTRNGRTMLDTASNLNFKGITTTSATFTWVNPANYVTGTYTTLVFVKAGSATTLGTPTRVPNRYTANANFGSGTKYQNDTQSYCVYRGNFNTVTINNLKQGINYYATVYVVRQADSVYNKANTAMGTVLGPPPVYTIGSLINLNTSTGVIDSTGKRATVRGVVYGGNNRTNGVQFVLRDATGGISVLSTIKNFSYVPKEGDSLEVTGTITQVSGLNTIGTLDTIKYFNAGHNIAKAKSYILPDEYSENDLVNFSRVSFKTPITNWPASGNVVLVNSYTGDTLTARIYANSGIGGTAAPTGEFSITGLGGQQSSSTTAPFPFNGYYVAPRRTTDITLNTGDSISNFPLLTPATITTVDLGGDTSTRFNFKSGTARVLRGLGSVYYVLLFDESNGDFSLPIFGKGCNNGGLDTSGSISYGELLKSVPGLIPGDSVLLKVTMTASFNSITKFADQERLVIFKLPKTTGLNSLNGTIDLSIYPNPANSNLTILCKSKILSVDLMDVQGKLISNFENQNSIDISAVPNGLYFVSVQTENGRAIKKIVVSH
ncbi:MAG: hypothetical protein CFE21_01955 [Bacteroidetes bacterium B1(2017)]|nr:MAG: hypothetical protein CFE21_01955 [Bacteroidetes bacterium B1(2017)]